MIRHAPPTTRATHTLGKASDGRRDANGVHDCGRGDSSSSASLLHAILWAEQVSFDVRVPIDEKKGQGKDGCMDRSGGTRQQSQPLLYRRLEDYYLEQQDCFLNMFPFPAS